MTSPDLPAALATFEQRLVTSGAGIHRYLLPGIPEAEVRRKLSAIGMEPPQELVEWFAWHNGVRDPLYKTSGDGWLLKWAPLSLRDAIADWHGRDKEEYWEWRSEWLPIALSGPATLAVHCAPPQGREATLRCADPWLGLFDEKQVPSFTGFTAVVTWWIEAIDQGWYEYVPAHDLWDTSRAGETPRARALTQLA